MGRGRGVGVCLGVIVAVAVGVGVTVGDGVGEPPPGRQSDVSTILVSPLTPSKPHATSSLLPIAVPPVNECATFVLGPVDQLSFTVS